ncbi:MAG: adenine phosphoribosyltransferase [Lachnospiraceae bacterium]|nr:adenine phosphoribosyltransferase [Lachnospiraceae bacterium]
MKDVKDYIRSIPNFPKEGVIFRDITTVIQNPEGFKLAVDKLQECLEGVDFDVIAAAEARGFIFASPIAYNMSKGISLVRKKGKLPCDTVEQSYDLEYGSATVEMHTDSIKPGDKVVLVDDLIATGGTLEAAAKLVEKLGGEVVMVLCIVELPALKGRERLKGYNIKTIVEYDGD